MYSENLIKIPFTISWFLYCFVSYGGSVDGYMENFIGNYITTDAMNPLHSQINNTTARMMVLKVDEKIESEMRQLYKYLQTRRNPP